MRLILITVCLLVLIFASYVYGQDFVLGKQVSIEIDSGPIATLIAHLEEKTGVSLSFVNDDINLDEVKQFSTKSATLYSHLKDLFGPQFKFIEQNGRIMILTISSTRDSLTQDNMPILNTVSSPNESAITITGVISDCESKDPLPYASIGILGTSLGTICNEQGEFAFCFSSEYQNDSIYCTMLGYGNSTEQINKITKQESFCLYIKPINISEITVNIDSVPIQKIVKNAAINIKNNYNTTPFVINGFCRAWQMANGNAVNFLEAAVSIYDKGYLSKNDDRDIVINEIKYHYQYLNNGRKIGEPFNKEDVRTASYQLNNRKYRYVNDGYIYYNNRWAYKVKAFPKNQDDNSRVKEESTIIIDAEDYSVLQSVIELKGKYFEETQVNDTVGYGTDIMKIVFDYRVYEGKMYLQHAVYYTHMESFNNRSGIIINVFETNEEYIFTEFITNNVKPFSASDLAKDPLKKEYNPKFWKNYNILKENTIENSALEILKKQQQIKK